VAQLAVLGLAPGVHLPLGGQRQAVLAPGVHRHLPDEHVLDGLQQRGRGHRLRTADAQPAARAVARGIQLGDVKETSRKKRYQIKMVKSYYGSVLSAVTAKIKCHLISSSVFLLCGGGLSSIGFSSRSAGT